MDVFAVEGLPEVRSGDDVAELVVERAALRDDDVVCVASTIVSKANGRTRSLSSYEPSERAERIAATIGATTDDEKDPRLAQAILDECEEVLVEAPFILGVTRFGHITVNAGIDRSNVPDADLLLLPEKPTVDAEAIRTGIRERAGVEPSVIVTDTSGRPFRLGQRGVALGWAGLPASRDWRGERDRDGRELEATVQAVVDELAAAANLVTGEGDGGTPVAVVRGFDFGDHGGSDQLYRDPEKDVVRQALREWSYARD